MSNRISALPVTALSSAVIGALLLATAATLAGAPLVQAALAVPGLALLGLAGISWIIMMVRIVSRRPRQPSGRPAARWRWTAALGVPLVVALLWIATATHLPERAAFALHRPALEQSLLAGECPDSIGLVTVATCVESPDQTVILSAELLTIVGYVRADARPTTIATYGSPRTLTPLGDDWYWFVLRDD